MIAVGGSIFLATLLTPQDADKFTQAIYPAMGTIIGAIIGFGIIYCVMLIRAPYKQRDEARRELLSIPGATPHSPRVAPAELHFSWVSYRFKQANPPVLDVEIGITATGAMKLESADIEVAGRRYPCKNWRSLEIDSGYLTSLGASCELLGGLAIGNHDIHLLVYANKEWWASAWDSINYEQSTPDTAGYRPE